MSLIKLDTILDELVIEIDLDNSCGHKSSIIVLLSLNIHDLTEYLSSTTVECIDCMMTESEY